jgi:hypothetical protein
MKIEPLSELAIENFRSLIDETIARLPDTSGRGALVRLGLYEINWTINSLSNDHLNRVAYLLGEIGFKTELMQRQATDLNSPIQHTFFSLCAKRHAVFHPDYLFGEAISIGTLAEMWACQLEGFSIGGYQKLASRTYYGALSEVVAN